MTTSIRALFRQAESSKKVEHPFAEYVNNRLKCAVCDLFISNELQWEAHIGTPTHRDAVQKYKVAQQRKAKRALDTSAQAEAPGNDKRQRREAIESRPALPPGFFDASREPSADRRKEADSSKTEVATDADAEWAAFQDDIAKVQAATVAESAAVINRPSTNTYDVNGGDDELDEVMNDLRDQFEEQRNLESRVLKLKEMRERLRPKIVATGVPGTTKGSIDSNRNLETSEDGEEKEQEDEDDGDEFDDYDAWRRKGI
ncbi:hypothetical protein POJ06DRAFT_261173 [Lipomyces tetrasporus]|uniref:Coiled-coil domain-containing protein 16 n=1 Tax=Lipomyces tetrasporus TaxID=54092 RepID=A0AAD7QLB0_9ASCO|nr:uncharacterized protein POJ06DRAFT_261173 [Lipomyces tetrasporus]KAJ8097362.1 hypothetical protein POJ06DRAFT_261173 [Lipomyces tetrasporus]